MGLTGNLTFVGFGFGPIQAGLFLYEAYQSGAFGRLVVAEVLPDVVAAVRQDGGMFGVNIAHRDRVESSSIGPITIENPLQETDRARLIDAIAQAQEIGTAVPSVSNYESEGPGSLHRVLAAGLQKKATIGGPRAVVYAAENHNHAAELLEEKVMAEIPDGEREAVRARVRFLNTVVGKMSGGVNNPAAIRAAGLLPSTSESAKAFLVEAFNRILITRIAFDDEKPFTRGISVFEEKDDLLPFEFSKLYGHNATHALAGYLASTRGLRLISDLRQHPDMITFLKAELAEEAGAALVKAYEGIDPLFTAEGYRAYTEDLVERMTCPFLRDSIERVGRDPARKLGWDDRLIGAMRLVLRHGIEPRRLAMGTAAALTALNRNVLDGAVRPFTILDPIWRNAAPNPAEYDEIIRHIDDGIARLRQWIAEGYPELESLIRR